MSVIGHSREDKRRWTLAGDSKAEVTTGPPIARGIEVRVIPEAEADRRLRGAVRDFERITKLAAWIYRDRREPDKVIAYAQEIACLAAAERRES